MSMQLEYINMTAEELLKFGEEENRKYVTNPPFPSGYWDNFFKPEKLKEVLAEFPELGDEKDIKFNNPNENKLATRGEYKFGPKTRNFVHFLNSQPFLDFLSNLTGVKNLIPDPTFEGGGFHQIKPGGYLKIHADFNKHRLYDLDRRLNVLIYLNEDWKEEYGGHFELWDTKMQGCVTKILPHFNRMAMFNTTDFSYHGHPDVLTCPPDRSRKSLALYYYTNGRPAEEVENNKDRISTKFVAREGKDNTKMKSYNRFANFVQDWAPPVILRWWKNKKR